MYTTISGAIAHFQQNPPKGEFVLVVEGAKTSQNHSVFDNMSVLEHINYYTASGMEKKDAIKKVAQDRGVSKREIYAQTIQN